MQPTPPGNGPAKGHVERTFSSINTLFVQHVASYTGSHTGERGRGVEGEAVWMLRQVVDMLDEWIVCGWQVREHEGLRHPLCGVTERDVGGVSRCVRGRSGAVEA